MHFCMLQLSASVRHELSPVVNVPAPLVQRQSAVLSGVLCQRAQLSVRHLPLLRLPLVQHLSVMCLCAFFGSMCYDFGDLEFFVVQE